MSAAADFAIGLARTAREVVRPLEAVLSDPGALRPFLMEYGWFLEGDEDEAQSAIADRLDFAALLSGLSGAIELLTSQADPGLEEAEAALEAAVGLARAIRPVASGGAGPHPLDRAEFWETFPEILEGLLAGYIERRKPAVFAPLLLLGIIDRERVPTSPAIGRAAYTRTVFHWDRLVTALSDPAGLMAEVYGWGADFDHAKLTERVTKVGYAFGLPASERLAIGPVVDDYYTEDNPVRPDLRRVRLPFVIDRDVEGYHSEFGLSVLPIAPQGAPAAAPQGVLVALYAEGGFGTEIPVGGPFALELSGGFSADAVTGAEIRPGSVRPRLAGAGPQINARAALVGHPPDPWILLGRSDGNHALIEDLTLSLEASGAADDLDFAVRLATSKLGLVLAMDEGDGFLQSLAGSQKRDMSLAGAVVWSSRTGLHFEGRPGLSVTLPVDLSLGGLQVTAVTVELSGKDEKITLGAAVAAKAKLGPVTAAIEGTGLEFVLKRRASDQGPGHFGAIDLDFGFKPPTGAGLAVASGPVRGGGFLCFDPERGEYAGALELAFAAVSLKAIVMLSTKVEGAPFALLAMVYARFPGGLELGFRFTLNAVGGMIGINRGFDHQALLAGLPSGALDAVLFPEDPVGDAPRILAALGSICPVRPGALTLALMAEIGWGSDYICALRLGVVLPLDDMRHVYLVAQLRVNCFQHLPDEIRLQLICDAVGDIGFDPFSLRIDGRLRDSRFGPIAIEGQLVLLLTTGSDPRFLIAAGGFHPNFKSVPAGLPAKIDRLAVTYEVGKFKAWFKGYFALAAGTLQFGAEVGCRYKAGSIAFTGNLGMDALIHLDPFQFEAEVRFNVAVEYRGHELFGVHVKATLWGPDHWRIKGHGSFSILFWDVDIDFDESWGDDVLPAAVPIVLLDEAAKDLANDTYWAFEIPAAAGAVHLAAPVKGADEAVHPLATLAYRQKRFPLGMTLDRVGSAPISGPRSVPVPAFFAGGHEIVGETALEPFAAGEYVDLDDDARLTRPSFEPLAAGVTAGLPGYVLPEGPVVEVEVDYEEFFLPRMKRFEPGFHLVDLDLVLVRNLVAQEAAGSSRVGAKSRLARPREQVRSNQPQWTAADLGTLRPVASTAPAWTARAPSMVAQAAPGGAAPVEAFELAA